MNFMYCINQKITHRFLIIKIKYDSTNVYWRWLDDSLWRKTDHKDLNLFLFTNRGSWASVEVMNI